MPVLTEAQKRSLQRGCAALTNMLPQLELLRALGEASEYWATMAAQLEHRHRALTRICDIALSFDTSNSNIGPRHGPYPQASQPPPDAPPKPGEHFIWLTGPDGRGRWVPAYDPRYVSGETQEVNPNAGLERPTSTAPFPGRTPPGGGRG